MKKTKPKRPEIEFQEVIGESGPGDYTSVRLSRVKYKKNPYTFIDIRIYRRGYDQDGDEAYYPTKKGVQLLESRFQRLIAKWSLMPSALLHPTIIDRAFPLLTSGQLESAVLQAFKCVEVRVRALAGLTADDVGTTLMRKAFHPGQGPLVNRGLPTAEREALTHLFAGAIGLYKNPCSHRDVEIGFVDAFEMLLLASHLLKLADKSKRLKPK